MFVFCFFVCVFSCRVIGLWWRNCGMVVGLQSLSLSILVLRGRDKLAEKFLSRRTNKSSLDTKPKQLSVSLKRGSVAFLFDQWTPN